MRRKGNGFTLFETVVAMAILSVLSGAFASTVIAGKRSWNVAEAHIQLQQELRKAMNEMVEDLCQGGVSTVYGVYPDGSWYTTIIFRKPYDVVDGILVWEINTVQYSLGGNSTNQLIRTNGAEQRVVANNIVLFQMRRNPATPSIVEIALQGSKQTAEGDTITALSNCQVEMRN